VVDYATIIADDDVPTLDFAPLPRQREFLLCDAPRVVYKGGIGSGKTLAGCIRVMQQPPDTIGAVVAPTYGVLRDATFACFREHFWPFVAGHSKSDKITTLVNGTQILWRSADNPDNLRGPNLNWAWLDEADYMDEAAYQVMLGRIRRKPTSMWMTTSPRMQTTGGVNWRRRASATDPNMVTITASTRENIYLPAGFVDSLETSYTTDFARQEIDGEDVDVQGPIMRLSWIKYTEYPALGNGETVNIGVDLARSQAEAADNRANVVTVRHIDGTYTVVDVTVGKWSFSEHKAEIKRLIAKWTATFVTVESTGYQGIMIEELRRESDTPIRPYDPSRAGDKYRRFEPVAGKYEHGHIRHVRGLDPALEMELEVFPNKRVHDDIVDALTMSITGHELTPKRMVYDW
jgi:predicted phage terminase large subunit-like protein